MPSRTLSQKKWWCGLDGEPTYHHQLPLLHIHWSSSKREKRSALSDDSNLHHSYSSQYRWAITCGSNWSFIFDVWCLNNHHLPPVPDSCEGKFPRQSHDLMTRDYVNPATDWHDAWSLTDHCDQQTVTQLHSTKQTKGWIEKSRAFLSHHLHVSSWPWSFGGLILA